MKRITTTIKREFLSQILQGKKSVEYREIKPYWMKRFAGLKQPFELRLINGMKKDAPEITVLISHLHQGVDPDTQQPAYCLHIEKVLDMKNVITVAMIREMKRQLMGEVTQPEEENGR